MFLVDNFFCASAAHLSIALATTPHLYTKTVSHDEGTLQRLCETESELPWNSAEKFGLQGVAFDTPHPGKQSLPVPISSCFVPVPYL